MQFSFPAVGGKRIEQLVWWPNKAVGQLNRLAVGIDQLSCW